MARQSQTAQRTQTPPPPPNVNTNSINQNWVNVKDTTLGQYDPQNSEMIFPLSPSNGLPEFMEVGKIYKATFAGNPTTSWETAQTINAQTGQPWQYLRARADFAINGKTYSIPVDGVQLLACLTVYEQDGGDVPEIYMKVVNRERDNKAPLKVVQMYSTALCPMDDYITFEKDANGKPDTSVVVWND